MCTDRVSKVHLDKTARCLSVYYEGKKKTSWDKTAIFFSVWRQKKTTKQPKNKVKHIYFRYYRIRIVHKSTTFKNRSSDRMMTSDWLVDVSDDRCTTSDLYKAKKKICVFTVTRPTLIFASDPMNFYSEFG